MESQTCPDVLYQPVPNHEHSGWQHILVMMFGAGLVWFAGMCAGWKLRGWLRVWASRNGLLGNEVGVQYDVDLRESDAEEDWCDSCGVRLAFEGTYPECISCYQEHS